MVSLSGPLAIDDPEPLMAEVTPLISKGLKHRSTGCCLWIYLISLLYSGFWRCCTVAVNCLAKALPIDFGPEWVFPLKSIFMFGGPFAGPFAGQFAHERPEPTWVGRSITGV